MFPDRIQAVSRSTWTNTRLRHFQSGGAGRDNNRVKSAGQPKQTEGLKAAGPDGVCQAIIDQLAEISVKLSPSHLRDLWTNGGFPQKG